MAWPGVASTRMIDDPSGLPVVDCAAVATLQTTGDKIIVTIAAQFSDFRAPTLLRQTLRFARLTASAITASMHSNVVARSI